MAANNNMLDGLGSLEVISYSESFDGDHYGVYQRKDGTLILRKAAMKAAATVEYEVQLLGSVGQSTCTCPSWTFRRTSQKDYACKHMLIATRHVAWHHTSAVREAQAAELERTKPSIFRAGNEVSPGTPVKSTLRVEQPRNPDFCPGSEVQANRHGWVHVNVFEKKAQYWVCSFCGCIVQDAQR